jgi:hypothetical protein
MAVKKNPLKHRVAAAQQMMKVGLMVPQESTIYGRQNQQLIGSRLMLVSFLYSCIIMWGDTADMIFRNPRMKINNINRKSTYVGSL